MEHEACNNAKNGRFTSTLTEHENLGKRIQKRKKTLIKSSI